jgi:2-polyprenyl-3-methyl-5-hydroxy-6-metoxy-1,4-benzoquinol methylase
MTELQDCHASEIRSGKRFRFGRNWRRFLSVIDGERIEEAEKSLKDFLEMPNFDGMTFLDIGSGSGLFSLAARRLGAQVLSFDYDPQSVACTAELRRRYFGGDQNWRIMIGSVLDRAFLQSLGRFDIVYSWGVLHHTGAMWQALENVKINVKPGGRLFIAIYNDCGEISRDWLKKKRIHNALPFWLKPLYAVWALTPTEFRNFSHYLQQRIPFGYWTEYKKSRGMSRWHDMIDWIGGYPYEFAHAEQLVKFYEDDGFKLRKLVPNNGSGCHQLVFERVSGL